MVGVSLLRESAIQTSILTVVKKSLKLCLFFFLDWDREKLLEAWMLDADGCCQRSGVAMPTPPPCGYNAWDTLPSPRTPKTPRSPLTLTLTSPTDSCLTPGEEGLSTVRSRGCVLLSELLFFLQPQIIPFLAVFIRYYSWNVLCLSEN